MSEIQRAADDLQADLSILRGHWQTAAASWRDATAVRFQRDYWTPCETEAIRMIQALEELNDIVRRAADSA